jgi:drug/metabolite transporter (DMT)-like permease
MFDTDMNIAIGAIEKPSNGLGIIAVLSGVAGAAITALLWLYQQRPFSPLVGEYGYEITHGGPMRENLIMLAALLGAVALVAAVLSWIGGTANPSSVVAVLCGTFALTYPVLAWLDVMQAPLSRQLFVGS